MIFNCWCIPLCLHYESRAAALMTLSFFDCNWCTKDPTGKEAVLRSMMNCCRAFGRSDFLSREYEKFCSATSIDQVDSVSAVEIKNVKMYFFYRAHLSWNRWWGITFHVFNRTALTAMTNFVERSMWRYLQNTSVEFWLSLLSLET